MILVALLLAPLSLFWAWILVSEFGPSGAEGDGHE